MRLRIRLLLLLPWLLSLLLAQKGQQCRQSIWCRCRGSRPTAPAGFQIGALATVLPTAGAHGGCGIAAQVATSALDTGERHADGPPGYRARRRRFGGRGVCHVQEERKNAGGTGLTLRAICWEIGLRQRGCFGLSWSWCSLMFGGGRSEERVAEVGCFHLWEYSAPDRASLLACTASALLTTQLLSGLPGLPESSDAPPS